jgi:lysophospholipase
VDNVSHGRHVIDSPSFLTVAANQGVPIWPFLQPSRNVSVLIVNDNVADGVGNVTTLGNAPNATEIHHTYVQAQAQGLRKMPKIPDDKTYFAQKLYEKNLFFGCQEPDALTIIYLPNRGYNGYDPFVTSLQLDWTATDMNNQVANGRQILLDGGNPEWPTCIRCAVVYKEYIDRKDIPAQCQACMDKHCWPAIR